MAADYRPGGSVGKSGEKDTRGGGRMKQDNGGKGREKGGTNRKKTNGVATQVIRALHQEKK